MKFVGTSAYYYYDSGCAQPIPNFVFRHTSCSTQFTTTCQSGAPAVEGPFYIYADHMQGSSGSSYSSGSGMTSDPGSASHYPSGSASGSVYDSGRRRVSGSAGTASPTFYASGSGTAGSDSAHPQKVSFKISLKDLTYQGPWDAAFMDAVAASVRKTIATKANVPDRDVTIHGLTQKTNRQ